MMQFYMAPGHRSTPRIEDYLRLANIYEEVLTRPGSPRDSRLQLAFMQTIRLLSQPSPFNRSLPRPFIDTARRFNHGDSPTLTHFSYDENREFFLSDLFDYIRLMAKRLPQTRTD